MPLLTIYGSIHAVGLPYFSIASRPGRHWPWNCGTAEAEDSDLKLTTLDLLSSAGETVGETSQTALELDLRWFYSRKPLDFRGFLASNFEPKNWTAAKTAVLWRHRSVARQAAVWGLGKGSLGSFTPWRFVVLMLGENVMSYRLYIDSRLGESVIVPICLVAFHLSSSCSSTGDTVPCDRTAR